MKIEKTSSNML